jgi:hypothetical protein
MDKRGGLIALLFGREAVRRFRSLQCGCSELDSLPGPDASPPFRALNPSHPRRKKRAARFAGGPSWEAPKEGAAAGTAAHSVSQIEKPRALMALNLVTRNARATTAGKSDLALMTIKAAQRCARQPHGRRSFLR